MSMLGAFLRGAAGPGLIDLSNRMDKRDAAASEEARRKRERDEEMAWKSAEAQKERDSRAASDAIRTRRSGSSGGVDDGDGAMMEYAIAKAMEQDKGLDYASAKAAVLGSMEGRNTFERTEDVTEAIDDGDRARHVTRQEARPDLERYAKLNASIAEALGTYRSAAKSNMKDLREGEKVQWQTRSGMLAQQRPDAAATLGRGVAVSDGKDLVGGDSNVTRDRFSGATTVTPIGQSEIVKNQAQASSAIRANRDATDGLKLPPAVKAEITNLDKRESELAGAITKAQAEDTWDPTKSPGQRELQANLAAIRLRRSQLIAPYLNGGKAGNADPLGIMGDEPKAKPSQADVRKAEPKVEGSGMLPQPTAKNDPYAGMSFAERRAAILERERAARERKQAVNASPEMQALRRQHQAALRAGDAVKANAIMEQINKMLREAA